MESHTYNHFSTNLLEEDNVLTKRRYSLPRNEQSALSLEALPREAKSENDHCYFIKLYDDGRQGVFKVDQDFKHEGAQNSQFDAIDSLGKFEISFSGFTHS